MKITIHRQFLVSVRRNYAETLSRYKLLIWLFVQHFENVEFIFPLLFQPLSQFLRFICQLRLEQL